MEARLEFRRSASMALAQGFPDTRKLPETIPDGFAAWTSTVLKRVGKMIKTIVSPLYYAQRVRYYQCDDLIKLPHLNGNPLMRVENFEGVSAVPDDVAEFVDPLPGETLTVLYVGRKIAGFARAAFKNRYSADLDRVIEVAAGEVLLYQVYVLPAYQSLKMTAYLLSSAARTFLNEGFSRVIIATAQNNPSWQKAIERAGFRLYKTEKKVRILGKKFLSEESVSNGTVVRNP